MRTHFDWVIIQKKENKIETFEAPQNKSFYMKM
jgi:hypothetical protein